MRYTIVIEQYRIAHHPSYTRAEEQVRIKMPAGTLREVVLEKLKLVAMILGLTVFSKADDPAVLYTSADGTIGAYLFEEPE